MGRNDGRVVIFLYNLFVLFFYPVLIFLGGFWSIEAKVHNGHTVGVVAVLLIFLPEIIFGLKWGLNSTFGGRIFTILSSIGAALILHLILRQYYMVRVQAPITYYTTHVLLILGIIWTIVIEFNENLRDHILLYPQEQWLVPNAEDDTERSYWHGIFKVFFIISLVFLVYVKFLM